METLLDVWRSLQAARCRIERMPFAALTDADKAEYRLVIALLRAWRNTSGV